MTDDRFRYCIYCNADCFDEDVEHGPDCPATTGLWPITPERHGMVCMDCAQPFAVGDVYALRPADNERVYEVVCVGCRVLNPEDAA